MSFLAILLSNCVCVCWCFLSFTFVVFVIAWQLLCYCNCSALVGNFFCLLFLVWFVNFVLCAGASLDTTTKACRQRASNSDQWNCSETVFILLFFSGSLMTSHQLCQLLCSFLWFFLLCTLYFLLFCANNCGLLSNQSCLFVLVVLLALVVSTVLVVLILLLFLLLAMVFIDFCSS